MGGHSTDVVDARAAGDVIAGKSTDCLVSASLFSWCTMIKQIELLVVVVNVVD